MLCYNVVVMMKNGCSQNEQVFFTLGGSVPSPIAQGSKERNNNYFGVWHSLVVRLVRDQEAAGSNPVTPTNMYIAKSVLFNKIGADFLEIFPGRKKYVDLSLLRYRIGILFVNFCFFVPV